MRRGCVIATDIKKHSTVAAGEAPKRGALADAILSINDVVPVATGTEQRQIAAGLQALGVDLAKTPITTMRANAEALHRIEYSFDGEVFLPASGVLHFGSEASANSWAAANSTYLSYGDRCYIGTVGYVWHGGQVWRLASLSGTFRASPGGMTNAQMSVIARVSLPASAPIGMYVVNISSITGATSAGPHYQRVVFAGVEITNTSDDRMDAQPANVDVSRSDSLLYRHGGGAADVELGVQVNGASPYLRAARLTVLYVG